MPPKAKLVQKLLDKSHQLNDLNRFINEREANLERIGYGRPSPSSSSAASSSSQGPASSSARATPRANGDSDDQDGDEDGEEVMVEASDEEVPQTQPVPSARASSSNKSGRATPTPSSSGAPPCGAPPQPPPVPQDRIYAAGYIPQLPERKRRYVCPHCHYYKDEERLRAWRRHHLVHECPRYKRDDPDATPAVIGLVRLCPAYRSYDINDCPTHYMNGHQDISLSIKQHKLATETMDMCHDVHQQSQQPSARGRGRGRGRGGAAAGRGRGGRTPEQFKFQDKALADFMGLSASPNGVQDGIDRLRSSLKEQGGAGARSMTRAIQLASTKATNDSQTIDLRDDEDSDDADGDDEHEREERGDRKIEAKQPPVGLPQNKPMNTPSVVEAAAARLASSIPSSSPLHNRLTAGDSNMARAQSSLAVSQVNAGYHRSSSPAARASSLPRPVIAASPASSSSSMQPPVSPISPASSAQSSSSGSGGTRKRRTARMSTLPSPSSSSIATPPGGPGFISRSSTAPRAPMMSSADSKEDRVQQKPQSIAAVVDLRGADELDDEEYAAGAQTELSDNPDDDDEYYNRNGDGGNGDHDEDNYEREMVQAMLLSDQEYTLDQCQQAKRIKYDRPVPPVTVSSSSSSSSQHDDRARGVKRPRTCSPAPVLPIVSSLSSQRLTDEEKSKHNAAVKQLTHAQCVLIDNDLDDAIIYDMRAGLRHWNANRQRNYMVLGEYCDRFIEMYPQYHYLFHMPLHSPITQCMRGNRNYKACAPPSTERQVDTALAAAAAAGAHASLATSLPWPPILPVPPLPTVHIETPASTTPEYTPTNPTPS